MIIDRTPKSPDDELLEALELSRDASTFAEVDPRLDAICATLKRTLEILRHRRRQRRDQVPSLLRVSQHQAVRVGVIERILGNLDAAPTKSALHAAWRFRRLLSKLLWIGLRRFRF
jgi:hypothetical protein